MNKDTRWRVSVVQKYVAPKAGMTSTGLPNGLPGTLVTLIADLSVTALTAQEALAKGEAWIGTAGIKDAYVESVCMDGVPRTDLIDIETRAVTKEE